ncbi:SET domain-containing protein-lysine N-methyltransferase [Kamptonema formosum]|uniref:SET domain-containing protein-lysine N-methyltransferase n=1 Tax=Kamptonema formosum TaxID=331992 RepID=UPI000694291B|nr:SET domain-containing protein-lysine N-methyltransferase [Oscillatoria sp. PCC 10802]
MVLATAPYVKDELVCVGMPVGVAPKRDKYSVQKGDQLHVYLNEPAEVFSHSCDPNLYIKDNEFGGYNFYAARNIGVGEELAWHYGMTEATSFNHFQCCCGSKNCLEKALGFKELTGHLQAKLCRLGVANYLQVWHASQTYDAPESAESGYCRKEAEPT